jgi:hypothetical protein
VIPSAARRKREGSEEHFKIKLYRRGKTGARDIEDR